MVRLLWKHSQGFAVTWRDKQARSHLPGPQRGSPDRRASASFSAMRILRYTLRTAAVLSAIVRLRHCRLIRLASHALLYSHAFLKTPFSEFACGAGNTFGCCGGGLEPRPSVGKCSRKRILWRPR